MITVRRIIGPRSPALLVTLALAAGLHAQVPPRTESGTTLEVPSVSAALGQVYSVRYPSHSGQVTFTSDAPIEVIVGTTNKVVGYAVMEVREGRPTGRIAAGGFRLPVRSFDTGIPLRNEHLEQETFFDAGTYPDITFEIVESRDVEPVDSGDGFTTYRLVLHGRMTIRNVTRLIDVPARVTLLPASDLTRNAGPGDVMAIRCSYTIKRTDYDVGTGFVNAELANEIKIDQAIILTTVPFEARFERSDDPQRDRRLQNFEVLVNDLEDIDAAVAYGRGLAEQYRDDAAALNSLVWKAATAESANVDRFDFVDEAMMRAKELTGGTDANVLDTIARVYYERKDVGQALAWQRRAVEHRSTAVDPDEVVTTLHKYERDAGVPLTNVPGMEVQDLPQTPEMLDRYVGTYKSDDPVLELRCVAVRGRLHIEPPGAPQPIPLLYQGDHLFRFAVQTKAKLFFTVDGDGPASSVRLHQGPNVIIARRVATP